MLFVYPSSPRPRFIPPNVLLLGLHRPRRPRGPRAGLRARQHGQAEAALSVTNQQPEMPALTVGVRLGSHHQARHAARTRVSRPTRGSQAQQARQCWASSAAPAEGPLQLGSEARPSRGSVRSAPRCAGGRRASDAHPLSRPRSSKPMPSAGPTVGGIASSPTGSAAPGTPPLELGVDLDRQGGGVLVRAAHPRGGRLLRPASLLGGPGRRRRVGSAQSGEARFLPARRAAPIL